MWGHLEVGQPSGPSVPRGGAKPLTWTLELAQAWEGASGAAPAGIFACSGCSFPSQATRGFKTPGTQETTLTLPIVSIHLPRLAFLSSPSPPCLRQAPDTSQSLMVVSGPPMGLRPSLDTWCLPRDPLGSPWRFRPQLFGSRWVKTGQKWERHIVGRRELNNTWHLPPWTCSCDLPPPSVPTPYVPELLSPTVRSQPSPHPTPHRAKGLRTSQQAPGRCPMVPAKATDHQRLPWPGSLPLCSLEHPSGCLNKPLTFYGPQFPPLSNGSPRP